MRNASSPPGQPRGRQATAYHWSRGSVHTRFTLEQGDTNLSFRGTQPVPGTNVGCLCLQGLVT